MKTALQHGMRMIMLIAAMIFVACANDKIMKPPDESEDTSESGSASGSGFSKFHSDFAVEHPVPVASDQRLSQSKKAFKEPGPPDSGKPAFPMKYVFSSADSLLAYFSPVFVHHQNRLPEFDKLCRMDYDEDLNTANNVENHQEFDRKAYVYGQKLAETAEAYYLLYVVYHLRDYDTPFREFFFSSAAHDNDVEGLALKVSKTEGVVAAETWYHSVLLQFTPTKPITHGTEIVDGKLHLEDNRKPIILVQAKGHGVRAMQSLDLDSEDYQTAVIYRYKGEADSLLAGQETIGYDLLDFAECYKIAMEQGNQTFSEYEFYLGAMIELPLFLAGDFSGNSSWARPKPPWNWNSKIDDLTGGALYFHPAYVFNQHFGFAGPIAYLSNSPLELAFAQGADHALKKMIEQADVWFTSSHDAYLRPQPNTLKKWYANQKRKAGQIFLRLAYVFG